MPDRSIAVAAVATTLLAGLIVAGCGSSSSSSSTAAGTTATTATGLTKAQFLVKANAICAVGNKATDAAFKGLTKNTPHAQSAVMVTTAFVPAVQTQITAIKALGAPAGDEATVNKMLVLAQQDLDKIKKDPNSALGNKDVFHNFAVIAHPYGLVKCDRQN
jgi:hypothetical protein